MNVIIAYLDTMFSAYPSTPRLLEAKAELQAMMEDAYTAYIANGASENEAVGRVITEFGNLSEIAPELGITQDISPAAASPAPAPATTSAPASTSAQLPPTPARAEAPPVTLNEAHGYADALRETATALATGVTLCVLAAAPLMAMAKLAETWPAVALIALVALLAIVAFAVVTLVRRSQRLAPYVRLAEGRFTRTPEVDAFADTLRTEHAPKRSLRLQIAIVLWVLAATPVLAVGVFNLGDEWGGVGVAGTLVIVALGLALYLPVRWSAVAADALTLRETDGQTVTEESSGIFGVIAAVYWPALVAIYLAWSFLGDAWRISWVIWPIGGVLFGAAAAGASAWASYRRSNR